MAQVFCAACQHIVFLSLLHARLVPLTLELETSQVKDIQQLPTISFFTFLPEFNMLCHSVMSQTPLTLLFATPSLFATLIRKVPFCLKFQQKPHFWRLSQRTFQGTPPRNQPAGNLRMVDRSTLYGRTEPTMSGLRGTSTSRP